MFAAVYQEDSRLLCMIQQQDTSGQDSGEQDPDRACMCGLGGDTVSRQAQDYTSPQLIAISHWAGPVFNW